MRLSEQIDLEVKTFDDVVTLSSGVSFDYRDMLKKINKHKRGKFHNCKDTDAVFWPLGMQRAPHFAKKLDIDTRHFQVEGYGDFNIYQAWVCNVRFRKWARDTGFANDLDDFGDALADFGSTALKFVDKKDGGYDLQECDLMKLWFDPTIKYFKGQTKVELHELEEHIVKNKEGWEDVNKAWDKAQIVDYIETEKSDVVNNQIAQKRKFWERVGYFNVSYYENENLITGKYLENANKVANDDGSFIEKSKWKFMHTIHCGTGADEIVVFAEEIKEDEDVYVDLHISKYEDRWLRIGVYERLFDLQKVTGELVNYDRESQRIASLILFRSRNKKLVGSSVLNEAVSGLITDAELEQIGITNNALDDFVSKLGAYEQKADQLCMTPDILTGEGSDVKTFRGQAALTNMANSAFK